MAVAECDDALGLVVAAFAAVLFWIATPGYRRLPTAMVLLFASASGAFSRKSVLKIVEVIVFGERAFVDALEVIADAAVLLLFFAGMIKG